MWQALSIVRANERIVFISLVELYLFLLIMLCRLVSCSGRLYRVRTSPSSRTNTDPRWLDVLHSCGPCFSATKKNLRRYTIHFLCDEEMLQIYRVRKVNGNNSQQIQRILRNVLSLQVCLSFPGRRNERGKLTTSAARILDQEF